MGEEKRNQAAAQKFICIERHGGLGDVLMALGAAKALKAALGFSIIMITAPCFRSLAESCPHIDHVADEMSSVVQRYGDVKRVNLNPAAYGISRLHQIDAYLEAFSITAEAGMKNIDLTIDRSAEDEVERILASWSLRSPGCARILIHPGQTDPNRTWPVERWTELASKLIAFGHQVVVVGSHTDVAGRGVESLAVDGLLSTVNALSFLGTVALMRRSDVLVSADSGPVQLAGATDIGIVGLYSVVAGSCRLPFRHGTASWQAEAVKPSCAFHPCYQLMNDPKVIAPFMQKLQEKSLTVQRLFSHWCPDGESFACMKQQITVPMVIDAIGRLDSRIVLKGTEVTASTNAVI
jgi:ADP-heptose:LPS heptosyltransferase